jgi:hypothetical protein
MAATTPVVRDERSGADVSAPEHLNSQQRDTLAQIFRHPLSHNVEWHDVVDLLEAVGTVRETHKSHLVVTVGDAIETFVAPSHKDIDADDLANLRRILRQAGYAPDSEPA